MKAYDWRGTSDTESFLAAVEVWGIERALKKAIGMFAFALWDKKTEELTLARDRMGEKPLYYGNNSGYFFFGSELKALKAHPQFEGVEDIDTLPLFLRHGYIPSPCSIYKGIKKLLPGTYLTVPLNSIQQIESVPIVHYWSLEETVKHGQSNLFSGTEEEATQELEDLLCKVVKNQSAADVPIGAFYREALIHQQLLRLCRRNLRHLLKHLPLAFAKKGMMKQSMLKRLRNIWEQIIQNYMFHQKKHRELSLNCLLCMMNRLLILRKFRRV